MTNGHIFDVMHMLFPFLQPQQPLNSPFCLQKSKVDRSENLHLKIDRFSRTCANDATSIKRKSEKFEENVFLVVEIVFRYVEILQ